MGFEELFVRFWWLIFPLFGIVWAFVELAQSGRRSKQAMDLIKTYVEQGKEPPSELLDIAAGDQSLASSGFAGQRNSPAPLVVMFTAFAVGFGLLAYLFPGSEKTQTAFFVVAVTFGVLALGYFFMAMFGPRPQK
jgi:hypothetical protein